MGSRASNAASILSFLTEIGGGTEFDEMTKSFKPKGANIMNAGTRNAANQTGALRAQEHLDTQARMARRAELERMAEIDAQVAKQASAQAANDQITLGKQQQVQADLGNQRQLEDSAYAFQQGPDALKSPISGERLGIRDPAVMSRVRTSFTGAPLLATDATNTANRNVIATNEAQFPHIKPRINAENFASIAEANLRGGTATDAINRIKPRADLEDYSAMGTARNNNVMPLSPQGSIVYPQNGSPYKITGDVNATEFIPVTDPTTGITTMKQVRVQDRGYAAPFITPEELMQTPASPDLGSAFQVPGGMVPGTLGGAPALGGSQLYPPPPTASGGAVSQFNTPGAPQQFRAPSTPQPGFSVNPPSGSPPVSPVKPGPQITPPSPVPGDPNFIGPQARQTPGLGVKIPGARAYGEPPKDYNKLYSDLSSPRQGLSIKPRGTTPTNSFNYKPADDTLKSFRAPSNDLFGREPDPALQRKPTGKPPISPVAPKADSFKYKPAGDTLRNLNAPANDLFSRKSARISGPTYEPTSGIQSLDKLLGVKNQGKPAPKNPLKPDAQGTAETGAASKATKQLNEKPEADNSTSREAIQSILKNFKSPTYKGFMLPKNASPENVQDAAEKKLILGGKKRRSSIKPEREYRSR